MSSPTQATTRIDDFGGWQKVLASLYSNHLLWSSSPWPMAPVSPVSRVMSPSRRPKGLCPKSLHHVRISPHAHSPPHHPLSSSVRRSRAQKTENFPFIESPLAQVHSSSLAFPPFVSRRKEAPNRVPLPGRIHRPPPHRSCEIPVPSPITPDTTEINGTKTHCARSRILPPRLCPRLDRTPPPLTPPPKSYPATTPCLTRNRTELSTHSRAPPPVSDITSEFW